MEIHRPGKKRPAEGAHRARELFAEIGTIVIGVLIALGGEQAVEQLHWRHQVADTREALDSEVAALVSSQLSTNLQDICRTRLLDALEDVAQGRGAFDPELIRKRPTLLSIRASVWEVANTGQVTGHIPLKDRLAYARFYSSVSNQDDVVAMERQSWISLGGFIGKTSLDEADRKRLGETIGVAGTIGRIRHRNADEIIKSGQGLLHHAVTLTEPETPCPAVAKTAS